MTAPVHTAGSAVVVEPITGAALASSGISAATLAAQPPGGSSLTAGLATYGLFPGGAVYPSSSLYSGAASTSVNVISAAQLAVQSLAGATLQT